MKRRPVCCGHPNFQAQAGELTDVLQFPPFLVYRVEYPHRKPSSHLSKKIFYTRNLGSKNKKTQNLNLPPPH